MNPNRSPPLMVAFDLEGTLVDLEEHHFLAFELALGDLGVSITVQEVCAIPGAIGGGDPYIAAELARRIGRDTKAILEAKAARFKALTEERPVVARPGAAAFLARLQRAGTTIALGSLTSRQRGEDLLREAGLAHFFDPELALFREDVINGKPHPEVYRKTAERAQVAPERQLVFEDSLVGVSAAHAAGSVVVAMPPPLFQEETLRLHLHKEGAWRVYEHWSKVEPDVLA